MESTPEYHIAPEAPITSNNENENPTETVEESREQDPLSVIKEDKSSDSDANSDDSNSNDEQKDSNDSNSSQFYESSDSKIDYAIKIEDNDTLSDIEDIKTDSASADSEDSALGSLPPDGPLNDREDDGQAQEVRSEGSDSGLGSDTIEDSKQPSSFNLELPSTSGTNSDITKQGNIDTNAEVKNSTKEDKSLVKDIEPQKPLRSSLKRKCEDLNSGEPKSKKSRGNISFDNVTVYYFTRAQGFSCVPSQGGSTLGMEWDHSHVQKFSISEHALEQRRLHRQILQQLKSERHCLPGSSLSSSEDSDTEEEASDISESELDLDSYYFLQPVPTRQRRALLRAAGVRKIEGFEKEDCRNIRTSREFCGCACKGVCNPVTCTCSLSGIKCQVDRLNFPCGCTREGCGNTTGRIEFNPVRVRTHFIHTLMRLSIEKKNEESHEAAKRQWIESQNTINSVECANSYNNERCFNHDDGLLRDVNLTPRVEVESCVNAGNFNNVHCDVAGPSNPNNMQNDVRYSYNKHPPIHRNMNENSVHFDNTNTHTAHVDPYTSNILQGKGPPYPATVAMGYNTMANNVQRFPCDLNYAYDQHNESHQIKNSQSFSANSFEEFAHNSQMAMFNHYGHMYMPEYIPKPSTNMHEQGAMQYHNNMAQQAQYDMYKNTECENKGDYSTLMLSPYQNSNKLQPVENDENWFSHNTLLNLDQADHSTQDAADVQAQPVEAESNTADTTDNFGELIKKTMVESVTV